jgi:tryptophanyl-tRNA synthetase
MPYAFNYGSDLIKIMSLDGGGKMSKSENQMSTLYLEDDDDMIRKKIMKAKTDTGPVKTQSKKPDYIENLFTLLRLVSGPDTVLKFEEDYNNCSIRYGDMKKQLAEDMVAFMGPIREKAKAIKADKAYLSKVIKQGTEKARASAEMTIRLVRKAVGVDYI